MRMRLWLGFGLFLAVAAFFLWNEHMVHLLGALPYAVLLICLLIHVFMHGGHGRGGEHVEQARHAAHERGPADGHGGAR